MTSHTKRHAEELQNENAQLEEDMRSHAVVDQAIGVIVATGRLTPQQGRDVLHGVSTATGIKLRHVSELIVDWARTGQLCSDIRTALENQLTQHAPPAPADE
ncbi:ANTAR domain-containing protein [Streptomyces sp. ME109]|uniref:ANTAR domain-containing protein n=1 Tax=Streptomyces sp. me109 TaxID=1827853 RepID=UPI0021C82861|nr:ANTAR domain-containing protein [Streptomyces sp. me109]